MIPSQRYHPQQRPCPLIHEAKVGSAEGLVDLRVYAASVVAGFMMSSYSMGEAYWVLFRFLYGGQLGCPVLIVAGDDLLRGGISQGLVEALVVPPVDPVQGCPFDFGT